MMKEEIIELAKLLGIAEVGFTDVVSMKYLIPLLEKRRKNKHFCEFEEYDIEKRIDANKVLDNCKSIICAVFPYASGYKIPYSYGSGNISVSSYGLDYHKYVYNKLECLAHNIQKKLCFNYKICVDTSPLLDRAVCVNAGLGFIGKNNMFINNKYGSFVFLGYILTDLDMNIDCSSVDQDKDVIKNKTIDDLLKMGSYKKTYNTECKDCNICVKMCPNHAIMGDGTINAKRCVSYLTQTKEYIDIEYRKAMGHQIYGCDICQYYCPKNNHVLKSKLINNYDELLVNLKDIMTMTNKEFKIKYSTIAGSWRGKNIWKRNAIIASANYKMKEMYNIISTILFGDNEMLKLYAMWALLEINKEKAIEFLDDVVKNQSEIIKCEYIKLLEVEYE